MSNIEIKVQGANKRDLQTALTEIAEAFGVQLSVDVPSVVATADMTELFELVKARFKEQGFELIAESLAGERPKRGRKPKLSQEEAKEALVSSEPLEADTTYTAETLAALKAATLLRIGKHWQDDAGRLAMQKILKDVCDGHQYFRDTPPDLFPAVSAAVDAYEQQ